MSQILIILIVAVLTYECSGLVVHKTANLPADIFTRATIGKRTKAPFGNCDTVTLIRCHVSFNYPLINQTKLFESSSISAKKH